MSFNLPLTEQSLGHLAAECRREQDSQERDSYACFEIFRRAVEERHEPAWRIIRQQYQRLMHLWIMRICPDVSTAVRDDLHQLAFTKFWDALIDVEPPLQAQFPHLGALLKYLNRCTATVCLDYRRKQQRRQRLQTTLRQKSSDYEAVTTDNYFAGAEQAAQLDQVRTWIDAHVDDDDELLLLDLMYQQGLMPQEIVAARPDRFPDTKTVRRVKTRLIRRMQRGLAEE